ncbi:MAG: GNAT family N-acetyltransferase [Armatimonadota bacterium]|nr:MAG: GNAT family N-acetyltransferase [Armatimonadota bacterium]
MSRRAFSRGSDYEAVSDFLIGLYQPENRDGNWLQPIWEYAYTHPWFDEASVGNIGIWEDKGRIVGVATYELRLGEAFFNAHRDYAHLKPDMLEYAEDHLSVRGEDGKRRLRAYVNDFDGAFEEVVADSGYKKDPSSHRPMSQFVIPSPFAETSVLEGFRLQSLADGNDLRKWDRCLHRGFNHPGEPPADGIEVRKKMQSGPHYRKDLAIVAVAPTGDFVSFCGMWFDPVNRLGYVEPVATDPDYRRRGLGQACVLEGIRRCGELGATVAYVGTDRPFYLSFGFRKLFTHNCWLKEFA